jgi:hypothetical protein
MKWEVQWRASSNPTVFFRAAEPLLRIHSSLRRDNCGSNAIKLSRATDMPFSAGERRQQQGCAA